VNSLKSFFQTDWERLSGFDWIGLVMVVVISALMLVAYLWVWLPSNKQKFEKHRDFVLHDNSKE
jgi:cytochrome c oxidase cbb3-type subunit 4